MPRTRRPHPRTATAPGTRAHERAERGDVGHHGRQRAGERLDERVAAALAVAAEYEHVGGAHGLLDARVRRAAHQVHAVAQRGIRGDLALDLLTQRRAAEIAPQLRVRQLPAGGAESLKNRERVLVGIEMSHPQDARIPGDAGGAARLLLVPGAEAAGGLGDLVEALRRSDQPGAAERLGLRTRAEGESGRGGEAAPPHSPAPPARRAVGMILQQDRQCRGDRGECDDVGAKAEAMHVQHVGAQRGEQFPERGRPGERRLRRRHQEVIVDPLLFEARRVATGLQHRNAHPGRARCLRHVHERGPVAQECRGSRRCGSRKKLSCATCSAAVAAEGCGSTGTLRCC